MFKLVKKSSLNKRSDFNKFLLKNKQKGAYFKRPLLVVLGECDSSAF